MAEVAETQRVLDDVLNSMSTKMDEICLICIHCDASLDMLSSACPAALRP